MGWICIARILESVCTVLDIARKSQMDFNNLLLVDLLDRSDIMSRANDILKQSTSRINSFTKGN